MKNVAYLAVLSAGLLTIAGCCGPFCGDKKDQANVESTKPLAENEAVPAEATAVASAEVVEKVATESEVETVAAVEAPSMPMNEVAEEKVA